MNLLEDLNFRAPAERMRGRAGRDARERARRRAGSGFAGCKTLEASSLL